jgi:hypothetical protein
MAERRFADTGGRRWAVRVRGRDEWEFEPVEGNTEPPRLGRPAGYEQDPFELSIEELLRLLDAARPRGASRARNPFLD